MSTVPVILVSFPRDMTTEALAHANSVLEDMRLPIVALIPDDSYTPTEDDFHTVIRNTHPEDPTSFLRYRLRALDFIERSTNMEIVGVVEFDYRYNVVWDGIPQFAKLGGYISGSAISATNF